MLETSDEIVRMLDRCPFDDRFAYGSVRGGHCGQIERNNRISSNIGIVAAIDLTASGVDFQCFEID